MKHFYTIIQSSFPKALKTVLWLLKLMIPISFGVAVLQHLGIVNLISEYLEPLFLIIGLPGEASIVFITSIFVPLYIPIAIIATLPLSMRDITILAVMCLIAHNLFVETAVQKKTGSNFSIIFFLRISMALVAAYILNMILPTNNQSVLSDAVVVKELRFFEMLLEWLISTAWLILKVSLIIFSLMAL